MVMLLVAVSVGIAACGPGNSSEDPPTPSTVQHSSQPSATGSSNLTHASELVGAVIAYSSAYLAGEGSRAFAILSHRCQLKVGLARMRTLSTAAKATYGPMPPLEVNAKAKSPKSALMTYTFRAAALDKSKQPWIYQGGWKQDQC
jgi:hypothetical protein